MQEGQELLTPALSKWCDAWCEQCNPMEQHQRPPTSTRLDVVVVFYPLHCQTPLGESRRLHRIPVPFTPEELRDVPLKPTPARKKTPSSTGPRHLKSEITPESLVSQRARLKKMGPPRTTRQTNPWMASLSREMVKRRRQLDPDRPSTSWELKGLEQQSRTWK